MFLPTTLILLPKPKQIVLIPEPNQADLVLSCMSKAYKTWMALNEKFKLYQTCETTCYSHAIPRDYIGTQACRRSASVVIIFLFLQDLHKHQLLCFSSSKHMI